MFKKFNFDNACNLYNPCEYDPTLPFEELELILTQDMFQATFVIADDDYTVDVGWYPEGSEKGKYKIVMIKNCDWLNPVKCKRTRDYSKLELYMAEYLEYINKLRG